VSRRNKKKRWSRKFRKMHHISKPAVSETPSYEPVKENIQYSENKESQRTPEPVKSAPEAKKPVYLSFEEEKSQEIMGNLKMVLTVSILCLLFLGILYFFELRHDWVSGINEEVKSLLSGWTW